MCRTLEPEFVQFEAADRPSVRMYFHESVNDLTDMEDNEERPRRKSSHKQ